MNADAPPLIPPISEEINEFVKLLQAESDRGCALVAAAALDDSLVCAIKARLVGQDAVKSRMLKQSGPVGSFSSRIDMAYLLGALSENEHRDLHLIRRIRNEFGHVATPLSFDTQSIRSQCSELRMVPLTFPARFRFMLATSMLRGRLGAESKFVCAHRPPDDVDVMEVIVASALSVNADQLAAAIVESHLTATKT